MSKNECLRCDCYDEDVGCTMPSIDKCYACSLYERETERKVKKINMDSRGLASHINYLGMERCARKIILKNNLAKAEDIAIMTDLEVYDILLQKYEVVMCEHENILLIDKEKMEEFNSMAVYLSR